MVPCIRSTVPLSVSILVAALGTVPLQADPGTTSLSLESPAVWLAAKDWPRLQAWFRQPAFNVRDGLDDYDEDYRGGGVTRSRPVRGRFETIDWRAVGEVQRVESRPGGYSP